MPRSSRGKRSLEWPPIISLAVTGAQGVSVFRCVVPGEDPGSDMRGSGLGAPIGVRDDKIACGEKVFLPHSSWGRNIRSTRPGNLRSASRMPVTRLTSSLHVLPGDGYKSRYENPVYRR